MDHCAIFISELEIQMKLNIMRVQAGNIAACILALLLAACGREIQTASALEPNGDTACAVDGMLLKDFPGPKAQIIYAEGKPDFFCDLMDLFSMVLSPEQKRKVAAVFVQDMGKTDWDHPQGNWIDAKTAIYVAGSKKPGSMGMTFGSFSKMQDAQSFVKAEGGKIVRFDQITPDLITASKTAGNNMNMPHDAGSRSN
jgi:copper chaperone NosL